MTKEEMQLGYTKSAKVDTNAPKHLQCPAYYTHDGWMQGAEWGFKAAISKAVQWLINNQVRDDIVGYYLDTQREEMRDEFIEEFRAAMESEITHN